MSVHAQCQIRSTVKMKIPITVFSTATIFTKIYVDVMDMTESHHGYKYIVCARDDLSRASEGRALKNNDSLSLMRFFLGANLLQIWSHSRSS